MGRSRLRRKPARALSTSAATFIKSGTRAKPNRPNWSLSSSRTRTRVWRFARNNARTALKSVAAIRNRIAAIFLRPGIHREPDLNSHREDRLRQGNKKAPGLGLGL